MKGKVARITKQRRIILDEIRKMDAHPTASELYEKVRIKIPHISLGTVYRNLEILSEKGLIGKVDLGGEQMRFDKSPINHYHIRCVKCGAVEDAPVETDSSIEDKLRFISGFEIIGHRLEFLGICPTCREKTDENYVDSAEKE